MAAAVLLVPADAEVGLVRIGSPAVAVDEPTVLGLGGLERGEHARGRGVVGAFDDEGGVHGGSFGHGVVPLFTGWGSRVGVHGLVFTGWGSGDRFRRVVRRAG